MTRIASKDNNHKINNLLKSMDPKTADSFTYKQKKALKKVLNEQEWRKHTVDFRPTLAVPMTPWSFYIVLLAGANKRHLTIQERIFAFVVLLLLVSVVGVSILGALLVFIYLLKSWLGVDLFPSETLGVWEYIKNSF